ncbi:MAG TPA: hypothetical protein VHZ98_10395 [Galbitalea sp.]|nr:hypothetical protein [Galbitalea sp.]
MPPNPTDEPNPREDNDPNLAPIPERLTPESLAQEIAFAHAAWERADFAGPMPAMLEFADSFLRELIQTNPSRAEAYIAGLVKSALPFARRDGGIYCAALASVDRAAAERAWATLLETDDAESVVEAKVGIEERLSDDPSLQSEYDGLDLNAIRAFYAEVVESS